MNYDQAKRIIDIIGSVVGIIIFTPVMAIVSLYIFFVSPGPVFADTPDRVGKDGKGFRMYKFRTMILNAIQYLLDNPELYEEYKKNSYKLQNDPRLLPGAKFLRRYSLDELPQFFNVLKGEMSLVGPRAYYSFELENQQKVFPESEPYVENIMTIKPGLTGPWQVGGRSQLDFLERVKIDSSYANNRSILYDLKIIARTPVAMISGKGAV